jgi:hypothetical protein
MGLPEQNDIETAAAAMEKAPNRRPTSSHEAVKCAVRDMLAPDGASAACAGSRSSSDPVDDPVMGGQLAHPVTGEPQTRETKSGRPSMTNTFSGKTF